MTEAIPQKLAPRRGRIFPERTLPPEELARCLTENKVFYQRCKAIFERSRSEWIETHYGWYIAVEPDSEDYFIDIDNIQAHKKALQKCPNAHHCVFCLNETGVSGTM